MKKKIWIGLLAGMLAVTNVMPVSAMEEFSLTAAEREQKPTEKVELDGITYVYDGDLDGYMVQKGANRPKVELKKTIQNKPVVGFQEGAFANCIRLEYIEVGPWISHIESHAFLGCYNLGIYDASSGVSATEGSIAPDAFEGTKCLSIRIMEEDSGCLLEQYANAHQIRVIRDDTYGDFCSENGVYYSNKGELNFASRTLSGSVKLKFPLEEDGALVKILHHAFMGCRNIQEIDIYSEGLYQIEDYAFANCTSLKKIVIPHTVKEISPTAFENSNSVVLYSKKGSYVEHYAKTQGIPFKELDTSALSAPSVGYIKTNGNHLTVYQGSASENASGYQFAIGKSADSGSKNQFYRKPNGVTDATEGEMGFYYMPKGTYYAFCRGVRKEENGKLTYGPWSKGKKFKITTVTPSTPKITRVSISGRTVKVTYSRSANATGYDVVLGKRMGTLPAMPGEIRPLDYGKQVGKAKSGATVTVTFQNVPKGTYYVGLHAYNRTRQDKTKVFSRWSKAKKITVR